MTMLTNLRRNNYDCIMVWVHNCYAAIFNHIIILFRANLLEKIEDYTLSISGVHRVHTLGGGTQAGGEGAGEGGAEHHADFQHRYLVTLTHLTNKTVLEFLHYYLQQV